MSKFIGKNNGTVTLTSPMMINAIAKISDVILKAGVSFVLI